MHSDHVRFAYMNFTNLAHATRLKPLPSGLAFDMQKGERSKELDRDQDSEVCKILWKLPAITINGPALPIPAVRTCRASRADHD